MTSKHTFSAALIFTFLLWLAAPLHGTETKGRFITITVPDDVIQNSIQQILPITLEQTAKQLEGKVTIVNISNFSIRNNRVFCHINLLGENLHLITRVANNDIRLKLGSAEVDFDCQADIRYDAGSQTLYVTPRAEDIEAEEALKKGDIGKALLIFLNGREFPVEIEKIQPIVGETGTKAILVNMEIVDIRAIKGALQLFITPKITTQPLRSQ